MISPTSRFLIFTVCLLSYLPVYASSIPNTKPGYLVSFSSSATSEVRPSSESLPCQGLLLASGHVATAPACAKAIAEQVSMGGTVNLLDNSQQSIGHLSAINTDETAKGVLSVSLQRAVGRNSLFPITELDVSGQAPQAYFLRQGESVTIGHVTVRLGATEVRQGVQYQPLHSDTNFPPGSPVISGNKLVCLADGAGACVWNVHQQASHISKRSAISTRQSADDGSCNQIAGEICTGFRATACVSGVGSGNCSQQGQACTLTFTSRGVGSITCGSCAYSWVSGGIGTAATSLDSCLSRSGSGSTLAIGFLSLLTATMAAISIGF